MALGGDAQLAVKPGNVALQELGLGEAVAVHGLQGKPQHNGKRGVVVGAADPKSGRYAVQIDGEPAGRLPVEMRVVPGGIRLLLT